MKKIISWLLLVIMIICLMPSESIRAEELKDIYFIFDKSSYVKGDIVNLTININNYQNVREIKLRINQKDNLEVKSLNNEYFQFSNSSIFKSVLVNEYVDNNTLRLHVANPEQPLVNAYKNNICQISFSVKNNISDIYTYFENSYSIYIFDSLDNLVSFRPNYYEKMLINWNVNMFKMEVYEECPDFFHNLTITNRNQGEYDLIITEEIDNTILGTQVVSILVFDKLSYDYVFLSKAVEIADTTAPIIQYQKDVIITDKEIDTFRLSDYITITDNYDINPILHIKYYDQFNEIIENTDALKAYLKHNKDTFIDVVCIDSSNNKSETCNIALRINDVSPPSIIKKCENEIVIKDKEVSSFNLFDYFTIKDDYDQDIKFIYTMIDLNTGYEVDDILLALEKGKTLKMNYFSVDNSQNQTEIESIIIKVIDETPPIVTGVTDMVVNDSDLQTYSFTKNIIIKDAIDPNPSLLIHYYINNEEEIQEVDYESFLLALNKGNSGYIEFSGSDNSLNYSPRVKANIRVIDTTPPEIVIEHLKQNGKYIKLENIIYTVKDNFTEEINIYTTLNEYPYANTPVTEVGEYTLLIVATDSFGNEARKELKFTIIENSIIGCGNDMECFFENYYTVVIIVSVLMVTIFVIIIVKIIYASKQKKHHSKKEI